jgi:soluble lytic murein transglycosylase-like protein
MCATASAADIFRVVSADGSFKYSSQPLDASYVLYIASGSTEAPATPKSGPVVSSPKHKALEPLVLQFAQKHAVDPALVRAVIDVESRFNASAISPKGAAGAMQLMPATAARYGVTDRTDPTQNIEAGVRYLKDLLVLHHGNVALALASYNAGEGAVARHGRRIPPYRETMLYVPAVLSRVEVTRNTPTP